MSKRRIASELDDLQDEVLSDLDPDERLSLFLEAAAADKDRWVDQLRETCATQEYVATDMAYTKRGDWALRFLQHAVYELHVALLRYEFLEFRQHTQWVLDGYRDEEPSDIALEQAADRAEYLHHLFLELYSLYHSHRRFADDVLGVDLETWFTLHPEGTFVLDSVEEFLDKDRWDDLDGRQVHGDVVTEALLESLVERRYEGVVAAWEDALKEIPS